jgi:hypothetical protein
MTSIEWFIKEIEKHDKKFNSFYGAEITQAKVMHNQEIIKSWYNGYINQSPMIDEENCGEQFYNETFGQDITLQNNSESKDITELSEHSWEGCDGCTEQDEAMYKNGYTKGYNATITEQLKQK